MARTGRPKKIHVINDLEIEDDIDFTNINSPEKTCRFKLSELQRLAGLGFSIEAIAKILNISKRSLDYFLEDPTIRNAWETGKAVANSKLAQTAFDLAQAGDTTMCIWLTKVHLGWKGETINPDQNDRVQIYLPAIANIEDWNLTIKEQTHNAEPKSTDNENSN